jgi:hypothetical protein
MNIATGIAIKKLNLSEKEDKTNASGMNEMNNECM